MLRKRPGQGGIRQDLPTADEGVGADSEAVRDRWGQILDIFDRVVELPREKRDAALDDLCGQDSTLRDEIEALLEEHLSATDLLDHSLQEASLQALSLEDSRAEPALPECFGPYRIVSQIGTGGMGRVFLADRQKPFRKVVAIKVLKRGMDSEEILARFEAERQILAHLDHEGICGVFDGGLTEDGRPYFVMDYVQEGRPFTDFCEENRLGIEARLKLFLAVCDAVQHAHSRLVVHRDLKPSNLLVSSRGQVKLVDFGIAKLLDPEMLGGFVTRVEVRPMTPEYASPEQFRGEPLTTATDIYSLGVVLYEVLTARRPHISAAENGDLSKSIREQDPLRPSEQAQILIPKDLDTIVLKALRKRAEERYSSVEALASDLQKLLDRRPISARPQTLGYRTRRFLQRNKVGVSVTAMLVVIGLLGVVMTIWQARVARSERDRARVEARKASQVTDLLIDVFEVADPIRTKGADELTLHDFALQAEAGVVAELESQPEIQAKLRTAIARLQINLAHYERARQLLEASLEQQRDLFPEGHVDLAETLLALSQTLTLEARYPEAEVTIREALSLEIEGDELLEAKLFIQMGSIQERLGSRDLALANYGRALEIRRELLGVYHHKTAEVLGGLGVLRYAEGEFEEAAALMREAIEVKTAALGPTHHSVVHELNNLGATLAAMGDFEAAFEIHTQVLFQRRQLLGDRHPYVAFSLVHLGNLALSFGRLDEAAELHREALEIREAVLDKGHAMVAASQAYLADVLSIQGLNSEAETLARESLSSRERLFGADGIPVAYSLDVLAGIAYRKGVAEQGRELLQRALQIHQQVGGGDHPKVARTLLLLGRGLVATGEDEEARSMLEEAGRSYERLYPDGHPELGTVALFLGDLAIRAGRTGEAGALYRQALSVRERELEAGHWRIAEVKGRLGSQLAAVGSKKEAEDLLGDSLERLDSAVGPRHPSTLWTQRALRDLQAH